MRPNRACLRAALALLVTLAVWPALAENVDPDDDGSRYAYGENVGWINARPLGAGGPGVQVEDLSLSGWMWGENIGWISLSCANTSSCDTVSYGVTNDGDGVLGGYAWSEQIGWLSFSCANTATCDQGPYGGTIDPLTGDFSGRAWSENAGWITFADGGANAYGVRTAWRCTAPTGVPSVEVAPATLSWSGVPLALYYDVVQGDLFALRDASGDFSAATLSCLADDEPGTEVALGPDPAPGEGLWFLVRTANCGTGSFDSGSAGQLAPRGPGIEASGTACP
jgi:hypothetical protein